jgi:uncharacterized membrane protein YcaP (DUF421 family)
LEVSALQVKKKLSDLHLKDKSKTQRWLLAEVKKRGFSKLHEPHFSDALNGVYTTNTANSILQTAWAILSEQN